MQEVRRNRFVGDLLIWNGHPLTTKEMSCAHTQQMLLQQVWFKLVNDALAGKPKQSWPASLSHASKPKQPAPAAEASIILNKPTEEPKQRLFFMSSTKDGSRFSTLVSVLQWLQEDAEEENFPETRRRTFSVWSADRSDSSSRPAPLKSSASLASSSSSPASLWRSPWRLAQQAASASLWPESSELPWDQFRNEAAPASSDSFSANEIMASSHQLPSKDYMVKRFAF